MESIFGGGIDAIYRLEKAERNGYRSDLMKRIAYPRFLKRHRDRVFGLAFYLLRNREDAEDVTQEVFVRMWKHWDDIQEEKREAWLLRVTNHACIDHLRRQNKPGRRWVSLDALDAGIFPGIRFSHRIDDEMELGELQKAVLSVMEGMPMRTRSLLLLHYHQGYSLDQIADILGMSLAAVKTGLHRARRLLKARMEKAYPELVGTKHVETW